jgi:predicted transcriptional regulator
MKKKLALVAPLMLATALTLQFGLSNLYAANKIDCAQVMTELNGGKKVAEVAKDMKISKSSVYRCRKAAAKASGGKETPAAMASPAAMAPKKK